MNKKLAVKLQKHYYDDNQIKVIRNEIYEEVLIQHMSEFEEKISKYFSKYTGLHLYVHDIIYRRD